MNASNKVLKTELRARAAAGHLTPRQIAGTLVAMPEVTPLHPVDDEDLRAADGRVPGRRGRATRQRLLECTRDMLTTTSYRDVKVIDIAREAGTSPATFYQYFADVEAAILVLAEEMAQQGQHLTEIITDGSWTGSGAFDTSLALVDAFLAFWDDHRPVLRVMDLATDEGDGRFQKIRVRLLNDITNALADVTKAVAAGGRPPQGPRPDGGGRASSCRCSPTPPPTSTASSSGASAPPSSASRWPARCPGASPASPRPADGHHHDERRRRHRLRGHRRRAGARAGARAHREPPHVGPARRATSPPTTPSWRVDLRGHGESARGGRLRPTDPGRRRGRGGGRRPGSPTRSSSGTRWAASSSTAFAALHPCRGVVNVDQSIALGDFQEMVQGAEPMLRGDGFDDLITALFDGMRRRPARRRGGAAARPAPARAGRRPRHVGPGARAVPGRPRRRWCGRSPPNVRVPYLALHGTDPGPRVRRTGWRPRSRRAPSRCGTAAGTTRTWCTRSGSSTGCAPSSPRWRDRPRAAAAVPAERRQRPGVDGRLRAARRRGRLRVAAHGGARRGAGRLREPLPVQRHRPDAAGRGLRAPRPARPAGLDRRADRAHPARHRDPRAPRAPPAAAGQALRHHRPPVRRPPVPRRRRRLDARGGGRPRHRPRRARQPHRRGDRGAAGDLAEDEPSLRRPALPLRPGAQPPQARAADHPDPRRRPRAGGRPPSRPAGRRLLPARPQRRRSSTSAGPRSKPPPTDAGRDPADVSLTLGGLLGDESAITDAVARAPSASSFAPAPTTSTSSATPWTPPSPSSPTSETKVKSATRRAGARCLRLVTSPPQPVVVVHESCTNHKLRRWRRGPQPVV